MKTLQRLFRPRSIAVIGGGAWCEAVIGRCQDADFAGPIWPVHPKRMSMADLPVFRHIDDLPDAPDASFIGVNRKATIEVAEALRTKGAGGAVCFASGFKEADDGKALQQALLHAAGAMPLLGPNCYGFINNLDGAALWPDVHGLKPVERGVAIIGQSSNVLLNLTMQQRGLPIAYLVAAGNQAQQSLVAIGLELLGDERVTALGFHVEGFGDIRALENLAKRAAALAKPIVVLKVGRSQAAQRTTLSHTASLAGSEAGAAALLARLGLVRADSLTQFLSILSLMHLHGRRRFKTVASLSCSGGEASLIADAAEGLPLSFPPLRDDQRKTLKDNLGEAVILANPLDYHTDIWRDAEAMRDVYAAMAAPHIDITCLVLDFPRGDRCDASDWDVTMQALTDAKDKGAAETSNSAFALVASLPENLPEPMAERAFNADIVPLFGLEDALASLAASQQSEIKESDPILLADIAEHAVSLSEAEAKSDLAAFGLSVPRSVRATSAEDAAVQARKMGFPVVLKGEGAAHKSEAGLVRLGLTSGQQVREAARAMTSDGFLVEAMITDVVAELLIGVVRDPAHGFVLTLAAGGTLTELLGDSSSLLIPSSRPAIEKALSRLKVARLFEGLRGKPSADPRRVLDAIHAIQAYVAVNKDRVVEVEVNPLLITPDDAIAVDALIVRKE